MDSLTACALCVLIPPKLDQKYHKIIDFIQQIIHILLKMILMVTTSSPWTEYSEGSKNILTVVVEFN